MQNSEYLYCGHSYVHFTCPYNSETLKIGKDVCLACRKFDRTFRAWVILTQELFVTPSFLCNLCPFEPQDFLAFQSQGDGWFYPFIHQGKVSWSMCFQEEVAWLPENLRYTLIKKPLGVPPKLFAWERTQLFRAITKGLRIFLTRLL